MNNCDDPNVRRANTRSAPRTQHVSQHMLNMAFAVVSAHLKTKKDNEQIQLIPTDSDV